METLVFTDIRYVDVSYRQKCFHQYDRKERKSRSKDWQDFFAYPVEHEDSVCDILEIYQPKQSLSKIEFFYKCTELLNALNTYFENFAETTWRKWDGSLTSNLDIKDCKIMFDDYAKQAIELYHKAVEDYEFNKEMIKELKEKRKAKIHFDIYFYVLYWSTKGEFLFNDFLQLKETILPYIQSGVLVYSHLDKDGEDEGGKIRYKLHDDFLPIKK